MLQAAFAIDRTELNVNQSVPMSTVVRRALVTAADGECSAVYHQKGHNCECDRSGGIQCHSLYETTHAMMELDSLAVDAPTCWSAKENKTQ